MIKYAVFAGSYAPTPEWNCIRGYFDSMVDRGVLSGIFFDRHENDRVGSKLELPFYSDIGDIVKRLVPNTPRLVVTAQVQDEQALLNEAPNLKRRYKLKYEIHEE